jgi:hypothetical protein
MTVAAYPRLQPRSLPLPAARRIRKLWSSRGRQSSSDRSRRSAPAQFPIQHARRHRFRRQNCAPPAAAATPARPPAILKSP